MNRKQLMLEVTDWAIDHPGQELPMHFRSELQAHPDLEADWGHRHGWVDLLHAPQSWAPDEAFYDQLVHTAVQKRREATPVSSPRTLTSRPPSAFRELLQSWSANPVWVTAVAILVLLSAAYYTYDTYTTIGGVDFVSGHVMVVGADGGQRDDPVRRKQSLQTTAQSRSVVQLESGAEVYVDERSRLTFLDSRTVELHVGRAYFDIPKSGGGFRIRLPQGEVSVLGTAFFVEYGQGGGRVTVTRGTVEVTNRGDRVLVEEGQETALDENKRLTARLSARNVERVRWLRELQRARDKEELKRYFPSLAAPSLE